MPKAKVSAFEDAMFREPGQQSALVEEATTSGGDGSSVVMTLDGIRPSRRAPDQDPSAAFVFVMDPERWHVSEGRILPLLIRAPLIKGLNGIREGAGGRLDMSGFVTTQRQRGRIVIEHREGPADKTGTRSYVRRYTSQSGLPFCVDAWVRPIEGSKRVRDDREGRAAWIQTLIDKGTIPDVGIHIVEHLIAQIDRDLDLGEARYARLPSGLRKLAQLKRDREVLARKREELLAGAPTVDEGAAPLEEES